MEDTCMPATSDRPTLLLVHAHPDDESVATGGVIARAARSGHRVVLVTCTRGEEGEIHNLDERAVRPRLGEVRTDELRRACAILGVARLEILGYRDSGMAGSPANDHPDSFHRAPLAQAADRMAALLLEERPAVVVTYGPDGTYGHPDHLKAHLTAASALRRLERERGWRPDKTYWHAVPRSSLRRLGCTTPFAGTPDGEITTEVDVRDLLTRKLAAFHAHVSQVDHRTPPPGGLAGLLLEALRGAEHFVLTRGAGTGRRPERCLFEGL
jgi:N-acetyl-1-D-myo-inositol-2-amino-2-deoxy-alpha-D-glucopyranoside deacetylase